MAPPGDDPCDPNVGRKGLDPVAVPRLHADDGVRGRLVGARGLHQRLRHRQHGRRRSPTERAAPTGGATRRSPSTSSAARSDYVNMFDPRDRLLPGPRRQRHAGSPSPDEYDPRVWGHEHDYTETDGWNFAFHAPQDGQGLANLYGGRDALARQARRVLRHAGDREVPRLLRRHDPRDARGARRAHGPVGLLQPGLAPHPVHVRLRRAAVRRRRRRCARRCAGCTPAREIGQGYAGDEDNGEMSAWYLFSALGLLPAADGQPELRDRLAAVQEGDDPPARAGHRGQRAEQQHAQRVRAGPAGQRPALRTRRTCRTRCSPTAPRSTFDMGPRPSGWATTATRRRRR